MSGTLRFDRIPGLPERWWEEDDDASVWPVWGPNTLFYWGANSGNQFLERGAPLNGGGLASEHGPTRGRAHPHYVGIDTMSDRPSSFTNNERVYAQGAAALAAGHDVVIPVDLRDVPDHGKFSLGTGFGLDVGGVQAIHAAMWKAILDLVDAAATVAYCEVMWSPDVSLPERAARHSSRVSLTDRAEMAAYHHELVAASSA